MKTFTMTCEPLASCLAWPWEKHLLKINRNKLTRLGMDVCNREFSHLCKIGGYVASHPKEKEAV